ncbi:MAG: hypothetical protein KJZ87_29055, partial [Thermoguttaceae bacterium]|nr:hypothetical protein [Thermoguttaceae bacterium]
MCHPLLAARQTTAGLTALLSLALIQGAAGQTPGPVRVATDRVEYQRVDGLSLTLDLYLPQDGKKNRPAVVWLHG